MVTKMAWLGLAQSFIIIYIVLFNKLRCLRVAHHESVARRLAAGLPESLVRFGDAAEEQPLEARVAPARDDEVVPLRGRRREGVSSSVRPELRE
jgi:hypothetical protein